MAAARYDPVFYIQLHMICIKLVQYSMASDFAGPGEIDLCELVEHFRQVHRTLGRLFHAGRTGGMGDHRTGQQGHE